MLAELKPLFVGFFALESGEVQHDLLLVFFEVCVDTVCIDVLQVQVQKILQLFHFVFGVSAHSSVFEESVSDFLQLHETVHDVGRLLRLHVIVNPTEGGRQFEGVFDAVSEGAVAFVACERKSNACDKFRCVELLSDWVCSLNIVPAHGASNHLNEGFAKLFTCLKVTFLVNSIHHRASWCGNLARHFDEVKRRC